MSHQQSREIRQHQSARSRQALQAALSRTALGLQSAAVSLKSAYDNYRPVSTSAQQTLDDFGIPNEDPLLHEEPPAQNPDFVFLRPFRLLPKRDGYGAVANLDLFFTVRTYSIGWMMLCWFACSDSYTCLTIVAVQLLLSSRTGVHYWKGRRGASLAGGDLVAVGLFV